MIFDFFYSKIEKILLWLLDFWDKYKQVPFLLFLPVWA